MTVKFIFKIATNPLKNITFLFYHYKQLNIIYIMRQCVFILQGAKKAPHCLMITLMSANEIVMLR